MKKKFVVPLISTILAVAITTIPITRTSYAQCGCTCAIVCDNRCQFKCTGCGFTEGVSAAKQCCDEARKAIGNVGPCLEEANTY
jgi:hypothetical protein